MRDRDAAGQAGGRLLFAGHRGGDQTVGVGGAPGVGEAAGEQADDGLLVAARVDVERRRGRVVMMGMVLRHGDTFGWVRTGGVADGCRSA